MLSIAMLTDGMAGSNQEAAGEGASEEARGGQRDAVAKGPQERQDTR